MKKYETHHLVKGEDLNHHGTLFAARAAEWLIEAGFTTAACEHGNADEIVLRGMDKLSFSRPIQKGTVVRLVGQVVYAGSTSMVVAVAAQNAMTEETAVETFITFVTIDSDTGKKKKHNIILDAAENEKEACLREKVLHLLI